MLDVAQCTTKDCPRADCCGRKNVTVCDNQLVSGWVFYHGKLNEREVFSCDGYLYDPNVVDTNTQKV